MYHFDTNPSLRKHRRENPGCDIARPNNDGQKEEEKGGDKAE